MITPENIKTIKRYCIHEAGHALVSFNLRVPIKFVQINVKFNGNSLSIDGSTEREIEKMKEDLQSKDVSRVGRALSSHLSIFCGGMAAEAICYPKERSLHGSENDLDRINETLNLIKEQDEGKKQKLFQDALELAKAIIRENRTKLDKLADKLFNLLVANKMSFKIEGSKVMDFLSEERR